MGETRSEIEHENEEEGDVNVDDIDDSNANMEMNEDCSLSNPYYYRLLNSKLDSCPPQPFNERTNIIWGAVYEFARRGNNIESMSRWEQIQRGHIRKETTTSMHSTAKWNNKSDEDYKFEMQSHYKFVDTIIDINDLLQTHASLDDIVRNNKAETSTLLAKSTGSLDALLNRNAAHSEEESADSLQMRNHLKWKKRQLKLHIKKKRRDKYRMRKKAMQSRSNKVL